METSFKTDFRPLTHNEIIERKPLRVKIGDTGLYYTTNMQSFDSLSKLWANKNYLIKIMTDTAKSDNEQTLERQLILQKCHMALLHIVWELMDKPKIEEKESEKKYNERILELENRIKDYYTDHTQDFHQLLQMILEYNTRVFFLLSYLGSLPIVQEREYVGMEKEPYLTEKDWLKSAKDRISKLHHITNIKKSNQLWHTNKVRTIGAK